MGTELLFGQQGVTRFIEETVPGTTPTDPALLLFSAETQTSAAKITQDLQTSRDAGGYDAHAHFSAKRSYEVKVSFHLYDESRLTPFIDRKASGAPRSFTLEFEPDRDATTNHRYVGTGFAADEVKISAAVGGAWLVEILFKGGVIADPTTAGVSIGIGSRELQAAITDPLRTFASGTVQLDAAAWAILVGGFEATIKHGVEPNYNAGDADPLAGKFSYGGREVTGSCDISLDDGASEAWARTKDLTAHTISARFGTTGGDPTLDVTGCVFPETEVEVSTDGKTIMSSQSWKGLVPSIGSV